MTRFTDRVERDLSQISDRATPSSTAWEAIQQRIDEQDNRAANGTQPTMEVIMLDPDTNRLSKRPRTGLLVAACLGAAALVGGLVVIGARDDETLPADRPEPTLPADVDDSATPDVEPTPAVEPAPVVLGVDLPLSVTYFDQEFELQDVSVSPSPDEASTEPDDDPDTDYIQVTFGVTNPLVDFSLAQAPVGNLVRLSVPGIDTPVSAEPVPGDSLPEPGESIVRQWTFPVPAGTDAATTTLTIALDGGADEARPQVISLSGPAPVEPESEVTLAETSFGGPYSTNSVDFSVIDSFASLNRGVYPDGRSRPGVSNRRAETGDVFVTIELEATSVDGIGGVEPGEHVIVTDDGTEHLCLTDAPETYGEQAVVYTASCSVPVTASAFTFQLSSDKCTDADPCPGIDHEIAIDPSFTEAFDVGS